MDDLKDISTVSRLEIVELGRRRRWSAAERLRIVEASFAGPRLVSATARAHGISRSLLMTWRRLVREGKLGAGPSPSFAPVILAPEVASRHELPVVAERIEIVLVNGRRIIVAPEIDAAALARIISVLDRA
jgi:transposase